MSARLISRGWRARLTCRVWLGRQAAAIALFAALACASPVRSAPVGDRGRSAVATAATVAQAPEVAKAPEVPAAIVAAFHPNRLGAMGELTLTIYLAVGTQDGPPPPLRRAVVRLPAELGMEIPLLRSCAPQRLRRFGVHGCPAQSRLGDGRALVRARLGSQLLGEELSLWVFLGPLRNLQPTFEILAQGYTPFDERVVLSGTVLPDNQPYGEDLVLSVPAIATLPLEPDASVAWMSLTIGSAADSGSSAAGSSAAVAGAAGAGAGAAGSGSHERAEREANMTVEPSICPPAGFPFAAELTYASGTTQNVSTTTPCPR